MVNPGKLPVAVLGLGDGPEADFGSGLLSCLEAERFGRIALVSRHTEAGAYRPDLVDRAFRVPDPRDNAEEFERTVTRLAKQEDLGVVLPGSRRAVLPLARAAAKLKDAGAAVPLPAPQLCERLEKEGIEEPCRRFELPLVEARVLPEPVQPGDLDAALRFPATLLGGWGDRQRVTDVHQLVRAAQRMRAEGQERVSLLQLDPTCAFEVAAVIGRNGAVLASAAARVLADDPRERPWMTVTVAHPDLRRAAARLAFALQLEGPVVMAFTQETEFRAVDARPGLPLWIESCKVTGPNVVELLVRYARGEPVSPQGHVAPGVLFSQTASDLLIDAGEMLRLAGAPVCRPTLS